MSVSAIGTQPITGAYDEMVKDSSIMGQDDFLKMLVAQLQNQDPLEPMSNDQMMQQMTQFGTLEELESINDNLTEMNASSSLVQASAMIGKAVYGINAQSGADITGVVEGITIEDGITFAHISTPDGTGTLKLTEILSVADPGEATEEGTG